jgi:hypothetical protein
MRRLATATAAGLSLLRSPAAMQPASSSAAAAAAAAAAPWPAAAAPWPAAGAPPAPLRDLLIVGGGLTGMALAASLPPALQARSALLEKSNSPGRFSSNRARGAAAPAVADIGAQYFSSLDSRSGAALLALEAAGLVARMPPGAVLGARGDHEARAHYAAQRGAASVVDEGFAAPAQAAGVAVQRSTRLASLEAVAGPSGAGAAVWRATDEFGGAALFRACVIAVPAPQALQLGGDVQRVLARAGLAAPLGAVRFSTRLAVALYFAPEARAFLEAALPWLGRYVGRDEPGGGVLRYLSFESRKRRLGAGAGPAAAAEARVAADGPVADAAGAGAAFVAHTSIEFGAQHELTPDPQRALGAELVASTCAALAHAAGLAAGAELPFAPVEFRIHRWKYSQMVDGVPSGALEAAAAASAAEGAGVAVSVADGGAAFAVSGVPCGSGGGGGGGGGDEGGASVRSPPLIVCGDWLVASNFAGSLRSAEAARALTVAALE